MCMYMYSSVSMPMSMHVCMYMCKGHMHALFRRQTPSWPMYQRTMAMMNLGRNTMTAIQNFSRPFLAWSVMHGWGEAQATAILHLYSTHTHTQTHTHTHIHCPATSLPSRAHMRDNKLVLILMIQDVPKREVSEVSIRSRSLLGKLQ